MGQGVLKRPTLHRFHGPLILFPNDASSYSVERRCHLLMHWTRYARPLMALLAVVALGCRPGTLPSTNAPAAVPEQPARLIPLRGPLADPAAEVSGLTWYKDWLIFLPQYPRRTFTASKGRLYALSRSQIEDALTDSTAQPLTPRPIPLTMIGFESQPSTFQGCEAIGFVDEQMYVLVEATSGATMHSYLVRGQIAPDLSAAQLNADSAQAVPLVTDLPNMGAEALLVRSDTLIAFHEANGANVNPNPQVHLFDRRMRPLGTQSFPTIEYRITDATDVDSSGYFWTINYFYPGERDVLQPAPDSIALRYGRGASHRRSAVVERLVAFRTTPNGIVHAVDTPPIAIELAQRGEGRNWEGIARWGDRGFLLVTDRFPTTLLAFVPRPEARSRLSATGR